MNLMRPRTRRIALGLLALALAALLGGAVESANATLLLLKQNPTDPATFVGHGGYSADGLGQNFSTGGTVQADVPAGSTVVQAYLYGTYFGTTGGPDVTQRTLDFDGTTVVLQTLANSEPGFCCELYTARADVTTQVATKVGSGGGITNFAVNSDPASLDGVALVVLFGNPSLPELTIAVLDGGSKQAGDTITFNFASPVDPTAPGFSAVMSLGSGFSFQGVDGHDCGGGQFSIVKVDADFLTSCAGNYDDGFGANGALITVGGVGDSTDNPADPTQQTGTDDELYNLAPFIDVGETSLVIDTENPSGDDNLFLAVIAITAEATVTTEVCNNGIDDDGDGLIDGADPDCQVANAPPTADAGGPYSSTEGTAVAIDGTAADTDGPSLTTTWSYTAGGNVDPGATCSFGNVNAVDTTVTCTDDGTYTLTLTANDGANPAVTDTATLTVGNANPSVSISSPADLSTHALSAGVSVTAPFTDAGANDTHTCLIDWGDTTTSSGTVAGGQCSGTHTYAAIGVYTITVTVTDDDGGSGSASIMVVVFDDLTKVTGGGFVIDGKRISFGFVAKPGQGQIQIRTQDKHTFHGSTVASLSVSGNTATWSGTGKFDGVSGYTFTASVVDNRDGGGKKGTADTIRVTIQNASSVVVLAFSGPLQGGNIVVHS